MMKVETGRSGDIGDAELSLFVQFALYIQFQTDSPRSIPYTTDIHLYQK